MYTLKIKILDSCPNHTFVEHYYKNIVNSISYGNDCGVDLIFPDDFIFLTNKVNKCNMGIACEMVDDDNNSYPYQLIGRSSISNTPLMLANNVGIIDPQYRGPITAAFRCFLDKDHVTTNDGIYLSKKGDRLVQIVAFDGKPIKAIVVDELTETKRGNNGYGSTNVLVNELLNKNI